MLLHTPVVHWRARAVVATGYWAPKLYGLGLRPAVPLLALAFLPRAYRSLASQRLRQPWRTLSLSDTRSISVSPTAAPKSARGADIPRSLPEAPLLGLNSKSGGSSAFAPAIQHSTGGEAVVATDMSSATLAALLESVHSEDPDSLSPSSKRIQDSFVCSDLLAIDSSNGAVKRRIRAWFASGKIWQAAFMRVYEVSDSLVDDAIHERSLEEAEFGMIHATGRLNEYARHTASALASKLGCLHQDGSLGALDAGGHTEAELVSARNALRALAAQSEAVDSLVLARIVWEARESLVGTDKCLDRIPAYIRWSLAQSWTINAGAIAGAIASVMYYNIPIIYAASGGLALSLLALVWLGCRWRSLEASIYQNMDARYVSLRAELVAAHRQALLVFIDRPVQDCIKKLTANLQPKNAISTRQIKVSK